MDLPLTDGTDIRFTHISLANTPSHNRISSIVEDDQGFLWFGTWDGLRRYDGYRTREYRHDPANTNTISGNFIMAIYKDHSGKLWVASNEYLDLFDPAGESFTHYPNVSSKGQISNINQDQHGTLWLSTNRGLIELDPDSGRTLQFRAVPGDPSTLASSEVSSTFEEKDGTFWVATARALDIFDREKGKVVQHFPFPASFPLHLTGPIGLFQDHTGTLWATFCWSSGLAIVDRKQGELIYYNYPSPSEKTLVSGVRVMREDADGTLWMGTSANGILKLDRDRKKLTRYRNDPGDATTLGDDRVDSLYEDHEGGLWVGTASAGLDRFSRHPLPFHRIRFESFRRRAPNLNTLTTVYEDDKGLLWIGTIGNLFSLDRKTGELREYRISIGPGDAPVTFVTAIAEDHAGYLWFGTYGGGLRRFDRHTRDFRLYRHRAGDPSSLPHDVISALLVDRKGTLWATTGDGLAALDPATSTFRTYGQNTESPSLYRGIAEAPDGTIWLGTWDSGVQHFDPVTGQFKSYSHVPGLASTLSSDQVNSVLVDHTGALWVGTSVGLDRLDSATQQFKTYSESDGLPNSNVNGILEDPRGYLWLSTGNGLASFDLETQHVKSYSVADGLPANEFFGANAGFQSRSGEMFFCSRAGLTSFFPERVIDNPYVPPVVITDFQLFGKSIAVGETTPLRQSISVTPAITLQHWQNVFSFEFSALSYASPEQNRYRYRMEGLDSKWVETDSTHRFVMYTTLAPGIYSFRVQGSNNRGFWNERGVALRIEVLPPWWSTWWFRCIEAALVIFLVWSGYYLRVRIIARRNRELMAINVNLQRSQQALRESEERYRSLISSVRVIVWEADAATFQFIFVSSGAEEILGYPVEQWLSDPNFWADHLHPDDRDRAVQFCLDATKKGQDHQLEYRAIAADGRAVWLNDIVRVVKDSEGHATLLKGVMVDITERKQAEEAQRFAQLTLQETEERHRLAREAAGIGTFDADLKTGLIRWSVEMETLWGLAPGTFDRRQETFFRLIHPDDRDRVMQLVVNGNEKGSVADGEWRVVRPDGTVRWVVSRWRIYRNEHGEAARAVGVNVDITERKRAEIELQESEARYRSVIAAMAEGVVVKDASGKVIACNESATRILGESADRLLGRTPEELEPFTIREDGSHFPAEQHPAMVALRTGKPQSNIHMGVRRSNGEAVWLLMNAEPITKEKGATPFAVVMTFVDITERRRVEEEQRRLYRELAREVTERTAAEEEIKALSEQLIDAQEQERTRIARELHDDLGQQITGISFFLGSVRRRISSAEANIIRDLESVQAQLSRISVTMRELSHELHPAILDYSDLPTALQSQCKEFSSAHDIKVSFQFSGTFDDVPAEISLCFYRICQEALHNVAKHARVKNAELYLERLDSLVRLTVSDQGAGFSANYLSHHGLGLVSIRERTRVLGGTVNIESRPKHGTSLKVEIPVQGGKSRSLAGSKASSSR